MKSPDVAYRQPEPANAALFSGIQISIQKKLQLFEMLTNKQQIMQILLSIQRRYNDPT